MNPKDYKILLVDDEKDIVEICSDAFELEGFSVDVANTVDQALEKLQQENYHVVVSDLNMPGKPGDELLKEIRESGRNLFFYFTTGSVTTTEEEVLKLGATKLYIKPFNINELVNEIKSKLGF